MSLLNKEKTRILVIDDEKSIVQFLQMGLESQGFIVYTAFNGNDAIVLAKKFNPHIVLLDVCLPGMSGYEVYQEIKNAIKTSIIILTAIDDIDYKFRTLNIEVDNYMTKPFKFNELLDLINANI